MSRTKILGILVVYLIGIAACTSWSVSLGGTKLLGLLLWTSFFGFCNAVTWAFWWSRDNWLS
jgi:hypothetical protein